MQLWRRHQSCIGPGYWNLALNFKHHHGALGCTQIRLHWKAEQNSCADFWEQGMQRLDILGYKYHHIATSIGSVCTRWTQEGLERLFFPVERTDDEARCRPGCTACFATRNRHRPKQKLNMYIVVQIVQQLYTCALFVGFSMIH